MATITSAGAIPASPAELLAEEVAQASALAPGLTTYLPGSLVEDMASTATGAVIVQDQAFVDLVNSISPYTANPFILYQLGAVYGVQQGIGSNTSVYVTFTGSPGFVIPAGFTVSDGNYQYTVQDGGIIGAPRAGFTYGQSSALYCLATTSGSWAIPANTVTDIITSIPSGVTLTCTNLSSGIPGEKQQTTQEYQAQVIQAGLSTAQGMPTFLRTQLENVSGVQARLISIRNVGLSVWQVIVGGGDPYEVANAIFTGIFDISSLIGSELLITDITNAYPAVVTTTLNHGYITGQVVQFEGVVGMTEVNNVPFVAIAISQNTFSLAVEISTITWSAGTVTVVTANPHGLPSGTSIGNIYECTPAEYNGTYTFTQVNATTFTYPLAIDPGTATIKGYTDYDSSSDGVYVSGGIATPNNRNITVSINDYPDTYDITFVNPPQQTVAVNLVWNTNSLNYVSPAAVIQLAQPAIIQYINSIYVGQPINVFELQNVFTVAIAPILPANLISRMVFTVYIDGIEATPVVGTGLIYGDPESYFEISSTDVNIVQG